MEVYIQKYQAGPTRLYVKFSHLGFDAKRTQDFTSEQLGFDFAATAYPMSVVHVDIRPTLANEMAAYALGTAASAGDLATLFDIDEELVGEILSDKEIELCLSCGWWCETSEFDKEGKCEDCHADD